MSKTFQNKIAQLEQCIEIQRDSVTPGDHHHYMHGMLNGMIFCKSIFTETEPKYHVARVKPNKVRIRHKGKR